jgi:VWFA-related protein
MWNRDSYTKEEMRIVAALMLLLPLAAAPQFRSDVTLVNVPCVVTDSSGRAIDDLTAADFRLFDNGVAQRVSGFWRNPNLPLRLGVILDVSNSQGALVREHQATVTQFLEHFLRPQDRAFVVEVNENVTLRQEVVGSASGLRQITLPRGGTVLGEACGTLRGRPLCGGTALWNAVYYTAKLKLNESFGARALLILSDGNDTGSIHHLDEAVDAAQRANAPAYVIRYPDPISNQAGDGLRRLTSASGGLLFDPPGDHLAEILGKVELDLRSQYVLGFQPSSTGARNPRHQLRVEAVRPGLEIRARKEYVELAR